MFITDYTVFLYYMVLKIKLSKLIEAIELLPFRKKYNLI